MTAHSEVQVSAIVTVGERHADIAGLYADYKRGLGRLGVSYELIFVLDGPRPAVGQALRGLMDKGERIQVISLTRAFGDATALMAGFERASGSTIVTLPAYHQIDPSGIAQLVAAAGNCDMACAHRSPRRGGVLERIRRRTFHHFLRWVTGQALRDVGCGARAMKRRVLEEITIYGDQFRFLPHLAHRQGFKVVEVDVAQSPADRFMGVYSPGEYLHGALDLLTVFFLVRFTKKPLRFFGMVGATTFLGGALLIADLVTDRLLLGTALSDRPALLLSSLLVVLGLQLIAIGLIGELIIFSHARGIKDYQVDTVVSFPPARGSHLQPAGHPIDTARTGTRTALS